MWFDRLVRTEMKYLGGEFRLIAATIRLVGRSGSFTHMI